MGRRQGRGISGTHGEHPWACTPAATPTAEARKRAPCPRLPVNERGDADDVASVNLPVAPAMAWPTHTRFIRVPSPPYGGHRTAAAREGKAEGIPGSSRWPE